MRVAVVQFPASNCDWDAYHAFADVLGLPTRLVFHKETSLGDAEVVVVPGGFSYGDYLRAGAIARFSPIMAAVKQFAEAGGPVLGICNGFQILCEAGLLPGALMRNECLEFRCLVADLKVEGTGERIRLPIAHGEGNYRIDEAGLAGLEAHGQIVLRYIGPTGNPNGSVADIAGIRNRAGNVTGMMPHPERAVEPIHSSQDGLAVLRGILSGANLHQAAS